MSDVETALLAELQASKQRAEELAALLESERRRAAEAEQQLRVKEARIVELDRPSVDPIAVQQYRASLAKDLSALRQHSQRYSNASSAVDVVTPGIEANAATVRSKIATHFGYVRRQLLDREEKLTALVESLSEERLRALRVQRGQMDAIVTECEAAIFAAQGALDGDDFSLVTDRDAVSDKVGAALGKNTKLDAEWSDKIQAELPGALEEIIESHGRVSTVAIDSASSEWHHDLSVVSRIAEPPRLLAAKRPSQGNSDFGFMFDVQAVGSAICVRKLHVSSGVGDGPWNYTVYTIAGPWVKHKAAKKKWAICGKACEQLPKASDGGGTIPLSEEGVHIAAGQRQSFYIHCKDHMTAVSFVNRPVSEDGSLIPQGGLVDEDTHLKVFTGAKTCSEDAFEYLTNDAVRAFAGKIEYVLWCES
mmetsp:Transcript_62862/g.149793  ORF Transcript_62862/g.149793 Transcript_62862/m.149793 type:complete len:421 (+) Transcript_62862:209-1471(+)